MTKATAFFAALLLLLAGCSHTDTFERNSVPYQLRDQFKNLRFVWSAEPGIDLVAGIMVPIRAYFESTELVERSSYRSDAYPGYERAAPEQSTERFRGPDATNLPKQGEFRARPIGGVDYAHVLSLAPTQDGGSVAVVCYGTYAVSYLEQDGRWAAQRGNHSDDPGEKFDLEAGWGWAFRIVIRNNAPTASGAQASQEQARRAASEKRQAGPNQAPSSDVFGDWRVVKVGTYVPWEPAYQTTWPDGSWGLDDWKKTYDQCMAKAPDPRDVRARWFYGKYEMPYPSPQPLPAPYPGWPTSGS